MKIFYFNEIALLILFTLGSLISHAQDINVARTTQSSCGSSISSNLGGRSIIVQQSIGQSSVIGFFSKNQITIRQGFIQPNIKPIYKEFDEELYVEIFPNPFTNDLNIIFDFDIEGDLIMNFYDLSGRLIRSSKSFLTENKLQLELSDLENGIYLLHLQIDGKKVVKLIEKL